METVYQNNSKRVLLLILYLVIVSILFGTIYGLQIYNINYNSHSIIKHGSDALIVRSCLNNFGGIHMFYNPKTNRMAEICFLENGKYGIQITEEENEITSFIKNRMSTLKQIMQYLENSGYTNQIY